MSIIDRLKAKPNRPTVKVGVGNGQKVEVPSFRYSLEDDKLRGEASRILVEVKGYLIAAADGSMSRNNIENLASELLLMLEE